MKNGPRTMELDSTKQKVSNPIQVSYCHPEIVRHKRSDQIIFKAKFLLTIKNMQDLGMKINMSERVYRYLLVNNDIMFPRHDFKSKNQFVKTLYEIAEDKLKSKYIRRRLKSIKSTKEQISPKIEYIVKDMKLDN
jgi:hypothetical protein